MLETVERSMDKNTNVIIKLRPYASDCRVGLKTGESLGLVQEAIVHSRVGEMTIAEIRTICNETEVELLEASTKLIIEVQDRDAYQKGWDSIDNSQNKQKSIYSENSYGQYLFEKGIKDALHSVGKSKEKKFN